MTPNEMRKNYERAAREQARGKDVKPRYVPVKVRLPRTVRGDWLHCDTVAPPGDYDASANPYGALSVLATNGSLLGIKPDEYESLAWGENPHIEEVKP